MQGIYKITNINNDKVYIGRSTDIEHRWKEHQSALSAGIHHSYKLQKCYDALENKEDLKYEVIELVDDTTKMPEREQYYYDLYDSYHNGYNCSPYADNPKYKKPKRSFIFYVEWYDYLEILRKEKGEAYTNNLLKELLIYAVTGPNTSNDPMTFGDFYPPFKDWLKENNIVIKKCKFIKTNQI